MKKEEEGDEKNVKEEGNFNGKKVSERSKAIKKMKSSKNFNPIKYEDDLEGKRLEAKTASVGDILKLESEDTSLQSFGDKIELSINIIKSNFDVDDLRLKFMQAQILLKESSVEAFLEKIFESLILSLKLENEVQVSKNCFFKEFKFTVGSKTENPKSLLVREQEEDL